MSDDDLNGRSIEELTELLNAEIVNAERYFAAANAEWGVAAQVPIEGEPKLDVALAYRKHEGEWGLYVVRAGGGDYVVTRLAKASRRMRMTAVRLFPALDTALDEESGRQSSALVDAVAFTREWLGLRKRGGQP